MVEPIGFPERLITKCERKRKFPRLWGWGTRSKFPSTEMGRVTGRTEFEAGESTGN